MTALLLPAGLYSTDLHGLRCKLLANEFEPVLVSGKRAVSVGWQSAEITVQNLLEEGMAHPDAPSTGLRTGRLIAFDNDILDPEHARVIEETVTAVLGPTAFQRHGAKPGPLLLYRCKISQRKITIRARSPGSDKTRNVVEILGEGQQFVAYGLHPDTGQPYRWEFADIGAEPAEWPFWNVPEIAPVPIEEAVRATCAKLEWLGYCDVSVNQAGVVTNHPSSPLAGEPFTPVQLTGMLSYLDPDCPRDEWRNIAAALHAASCTDPEFDKRDLFVRWSRGEVRHAG